MSSLLPAVISTLKYKLLLPDPDASYVNNETAFASRPLASRVLSTASMTTHTQKARRVPSSSSISTAGHALAPDGTNARPAAADGAGSRDILSGLQGYRQDRERTASRMTDRTTASDSRRPGSALSSHSRGAERRNRDAPERDVRAGEAGRRYGGDTAAEVPQREGERVREKDRLAGLGRRERDADPRRDRDDGRPKDDRPRDREAPRDRHRPISSAPETPVTDDSHSTGQRDNARPGDPLRPENGRKESDTRNLLSEVPLAVQEAWICEDLGYVLQVRREHGQVVGTTDRVSVLGRRG